MQWSLTHVSARLSLLVPPPPRRLRLCRHLFTRQVHEDVVLQILTHACVREVMGIPLALLSLDRLEIYSAKQTRTAESIGRKNVIGRMSAATSDCFSNFRHSCPSMARNLELNRRILVLFTVRKFELDRPPRVSCSLIQGCCDCKASWLDTHFFQGKGGRSSGI